MLVCGLECGLQACPNFRTHPRTRMKGGYGRQQIYKRLTVIPQGNFRPRTTHRRCLLLDFCRLCSSSCSTRDLFDSRALSYELARNSKRKAACFICVLTATKMRRSGKSKIYLSVEDCAVSSKIIFETVWITASDCKSIMAKVERTTRIEQRLIPE
jgi:hypothetical protein